MALVDKTSQHNLESFMNRNFYEIASYSSVSINSFVGRFMFTYKLQW